MKFLWSLLWIFLSVVASGVPDIVYAATKPDVPEARVALEEKFKYPIKNYILKINKIEKLDGQDMNVMGVQLYNLWIKADLELLQDALVCIDMFGQVKSFAVAPHPNAQTEMDKFIAGLGCATRRYGEGKVLQLEGKIEFEKSERKWRWHLAENLKWVFPETIETEKKNLAIKQREQAESLEEFQREAEARNEYEVKVKANNELLKTAKERVYRIKTKTSLKNVPKLFSFDFVDGYAEAGEMVELIEKTDDNSWLKVKLTNGMAGWLEPRYMEVVRKSIAEIEEIERIQGVWEGEITQADYPPYSIKLTLANNANELCGSSDYVTLNCGGTVECAEIKNDKLILKENIEYGKKSCGASFIHIKKSEKNKLSATFYTMGGEEVVSVELKKVK